MQGYFVCTNPNCLIEPKVTQFIADLLKHKPNNCQLEDFDLIKQKLLEDQTIGDDLLAICIDQHITWADESLNKISKVFKEFLAEFRQNILRSITENFLEVRRFQSIFKALREEDVIYLKKLDGCLSIFNDLSTIRRVQIVLQQKQILIYEKMNNLQQQFSQMFNNASIREHDLISSPPEIVKPVQELSQSEEAHSTQNQYYTLTHDQQDNRITVQFTQDQAISNQHLNGIFKHLIEMKPTHLDFNHGQYLGQNQITDIAPFVQIRQLITLNDLSIYLQSNQILDLKPLAELEHLTNLNQLSIKLESNQITSVQTLKVLGSLVNLTQLSIDLSCNKINDIDPFKNLKSLKNLKILVLSLSQNKIINIEALTELQFLVNLEDITISLFGNKITDIKTLKELKCLINLRCLRILISSNSIIDITPLRELRFLINLDELRLSLSCNKITDIKPLTELKYLKKLNSLTIGLQANLITNIGSLKELECLTNLKNLDIELLKEYEIIYGISHLLSLEDLQRLVFEF